MRTCYFTADIRLLASRDSDEAVAEACIGAVPHLETAITLTTGDLLTLTREPAIVLKIETKRGFENLPAMLLDAMKVPRCGVMIARGDLAVECGFERLAEVQEEILWLCEAAHVPVIWATQVLESLAKDGLPSGAEITDAGSSGEEALDAQGTA